MVFETERLYVREMNDGDFNAFTELVSNPEIIKPVPQKKWSSEEILQKFQNFTNYLKNKIEKEKLVWGICEKGTTHLVGLCAVLRNNDNEPELGYRFLPTCWGKGYGTEITKHLINHCFKQLNVDLVTADVNIENTASVKILDKFLQPYKEFFNEEDNCTDRRYKLSRENWENSKK